MELKSVGCDVSCEKWNEVRQTTKRPLFPRVGNFDSYLSSSLELDSDDKSLPWLVPGSPPGSPEINCGLRGRVGFLGRSFTRMVRQRCEARRDTPIKAATSSVSTWGNTHPIPLIQKRKLQQKRYPLLSRWYFDLNQSVSEVVLLQKVVSVQKGTLQHTVKILLLMLLVWLSSNLVHTWSIPIPM